jgi:hypothetical protein
MHNRKLWMRIIFVSSLLITGIFLSASGYDGAFLIAGGIAGLMVSLIRRWHTGDQPEADERTMKINSSGLAYSWTFSIIFALIAFSAVYLGFIELTVIDALGLIVYAMSGSAIVALLYLNYFRFDLV